MPRRHFNHAADGLPRVRGRPRARSHCRLVLPLIHLAPDSLTHPAPPFLKRQCDRTPGRRLHHILRDYAAQLAALVRPAGDGAPEHPDAHGGPRHGWWSHSDPASSVYLLWRTKLMDYTKRRLDDPTAVARRPPRRSTVRAAGSIGVCLAAGSEANLSFHTLTLYVFCSEPLNHQENIQSGASSVTSAPGGSIYRRVVVVRKPPAAVGARAVRGAAGGAGGASRGRYRQFDAPRYIFFYG